MTKYIDIDITEEMRKLGFAIPPNMTFILDPFGADPALGGSSVWHMAALQRTPRREKRRARKRRGKM